MSHFYGTINGSAKNESTQRGTENSGLRVVAASWQGAVEVDLKYDESTGRDIATVSLIPWKGAGVKRELFCGNISGEQKKVLTKVAVKKMKF